MVLEGVISRASGAVNRSIHLWCVEEEKTGRLVEVPMLGLEGDVLFEVLSECPQDSLREH